MKRLLLVVVLAPGLAAAQPYLGTPNPNASAPRTLDPGSTEAEQLPQPPPPQPPPPQPRPNIVVVKPDGTVTMPNEPDTAPTGYYADTGTPASYDEPAEVHAGPTPELHVVRTGDTLWDICWYYFNDPWQWPKVWSFNPQITNPHWIYPGDLVRLLPRGVFAQGPDVTDPEKAGGATANRPPDTIPPPQQRSQVGLKQIAFVEKNDLDKSITIDGSVDEKELLGIGDSVYLSYPANKPPQVGQRYSIYKPDNTVKRGNDTIGAYVHILGSVDVQSVREDKRARGVIVEASQEIERGEKVGTLVKQYTTVPPVPPKVDAQGAIVAMLTKDQLIGQGEVVFIDLGEGSGVVVGNRMFVVRRGDALPQKASTSVGQDDSRFPARALGEVIVVEVGPKISVGLVTLSVQEMGVGDIVMMQKSK